MLMTIRDKAQGWIAWAIVILISIPFALWGIQEYLGVGSEPIIAKVNDREITEKEVENGAFRFRNELREQLGAQYNAELFDESLLRKQVLDSIIRDTLIQQAATDLGLRAGDLMLQQTILSVPAFQVGGQFNQEAYKRSVQLQGLTEKAFEERLRNSLITRQLELAIQGSSFITGQTAKDASRLGNQTRDIEYLTISTKDVDQIDDISEEQIKTYYDNNASGFMSDERVKIEYVLLNLATISNTLSAGDDELLTYFEDHKSEFVVADKKRIAHILFEVDESAADEQLSQITAQAEATFDRLQQGEAFEDVAKEISQDIASASSGGDLGYLEPGIFDPAFEAAVSKLALNEVSAPVRTRFGLHLIKVTEVVKGDSDDFTSVRAEVEKRFLQEEAEQIFYDYAERLGNLAYETPDSLIPVSEDLKLPLQVSDWMTRQGGEGLLASPKVTNAAFSEEALTQGYNSEPLELSPTEILVLRVVEHQESNRKPLEDVKDEIVQLLKDKAAFTAVEKQADQLLADLQAGKTLTNLASGLGLVVKKQQALPRAGSSLPENIVDKAFTMARPEAGKASVDKTLVSSNSIAVIALTAVNDGANEVPSKDLITMLADQRGSEEFELFIESLREKADIEYFNQ